LTTRFWLKPNSEIVADKYPSAEIIGLDLSPIQPDGVPPNVRFMVDDIEDEWVESQPYDLIHMRHSCAYLKDVDKLLKSCYGNLKPGGWCEFSDFGGHALCDDGTMPPDYPVNEALGFMRKSMEKIGCNTLVANEHEANFKRAGFKNVKCRIIKTPIGPWPKVHFTANYVWHGPISDDFIGQDPTTHWHVLSRGHARLGYSIG
jgi:SAM-dependent methyltransferase